METGEAEGQQGLRDRGGSVTATSLDLGSVTYQHGDGALALILLGRIKGKDKRST